jgi:hypothetical protein
MTYIRRVLSVFTGFAFAFATLVSIGAPVRAVEILCDYNFLDSNNIAFWDPCESTSCSAFDPNQLAAESNRDYNNKEILNKAQFTALEKNLEAYKKAASSTQIPWQTLAAIHFTETGLTRAGPSNGLGPYQIKSQTFKVGAYTDEEFEDATNKAAAYIKRLAGSRDLSEPDNIKFILFKHSGAQDVYIEQAKNLDFTDKQAANGEGSPYVMNGADSRRDPTQESVKTGTSWGELKTSSATELTYPARVYHGAYIIYASIAGIKLSGGCEGGLVAGGMTLEEATAFMRTYINSPDSASFVGGAYSHPTYGPLANCVSFSNYFINKYTTLDSKSGSGWNLASNLSAAYPDVPTGTEPQPYALFSSPNPGTAGHTGIILGVNPDTGTIVIGDQGWGSKLRLPKEVTIADFNRIYAPVTYVYLADYLKEDI